MPLIDRRRLIWVNNQRPLIYRLSEDEASAELFPVQLTGVDDGIGGDAIFCDDQYRIIHSARRSSPQGWFFYHYENGIWTRQAHQLTGGGAWAIRGTSYNNVWAFSSQTERILHWNGIDWIEDANVGGTDLTDISVYGPGLNDVVFVAGNGIWFRTGGDRGSGVWSNQWAQMISETGHAPYSPNCQVVWALAADDIYIGVNTAGNWLHVSHWNGTAWTNKANSGGSPSGSWQRGRGSNIGAKFWGGCWDPQGASIWHFDGVSSLSRQRTLVGGYLGHGVKMITDQIGYSVGEGGAIPQNDRFFVTKTTNGGSDGHPNIINNQFGWLNQWNGAAYFGAPPIPAVPRVLGNRAQGEYCLDIGDSKHNSLTEDGTGELIRDYTVASRARFRLTCRRGHWWANIDVGSLFHELNTLGQAQRQAQAFAQQALQDLIDAGEILSVTVTEIEEDPVDGTLKARVEIEIPEGEAVDLGLIPVGA
jgi:phage gp46-like protein